jgi:hypothetical protein
MTFIEGQRVRVRGKQSVGTVNKKLVSLHNVYIVKIDSGAPNEDNLVRGEDLEIITDVALGEIRGSATGTLPSVS